MLAADHQPLPLLVGPPLVDDEGVSDLTGRDAFLPQEKVTPGTTEYAACSAFGFREPWEGQWSREGSGDCSHSHLWLPSLPGTPALGQEEQDCGRTAMPARCTQPSQSQAQCRP